MSVLLKQFAGMLDGMDAEITDISIGAEYKRELICAIRYAAGNCVSPGAAMALRGLVGKWRRTLTSVSVGPYESTVFNACADELEKIIGGQT